MSSNAGAALVSVTLLAGCPDSQTVVCVNGVICPEGTFCTENAVTQCGGEAEVKACAGKVDFDSCDHTAPDDGICRNAICEACDPNRTGCIYPDWVAMTSPVGENLNAVWIAGRADAYAVGDGGRAMHYNGYEWTPIADLEALTADDDFLVAIWGVPDPREVFVVSKKNRVFHLHDGAWRDDLVPSSYAFKAISGSSRTAVYAAGLQGEMWKYDGATWSQFDSGSDATSLSFTALHVLSPTNILATGTNVNVPVIRQFDGIMWSSAYTGALNDRLLDLWRDGQEAFAVGKSLVEPIVHFAGTWQSEEVLYKDLNTVWGSGPNDVFVGGFGGTILRNDGTGWPDMRMRTPAANAVFSLDGVDGSDVFAVGESGAIWHYTGRSTP